MRLSRESIKNKDFWLERGCSLPAFDREAMIALTRSEPRWLHFGAGNIFRAFLAKASQRLLNENAVGYGITAAELYDAELCERVYRPNDDLTLLAEFDGEGGTRRSVIGSIAEVCTDMERMREIFRCPSLMLASFTITEKGYRLRGSDGKLLPDAETDLAEGASSPKSFMGKVAALLYERYKSGAVPIAMVSMDNCSDNGKALHDSVSEIVGRWTESGLVENGFADYIKSKVSFPYTMIDKITPRPDPAVERQLLGDGIEGMERVSEAAAAFVNAEASGYLVIEDDFPNGRPPFEKCGFYMTDRESVRNTEKMKVSACLNPLHTALAVFGCLLGYKRICDELDDPLLLKLIQKLGYDEGLPAAQSGSVIDPEMFLNEVINIRLPDPCIPDTPQRIACDTSQKLSARFGNTVSSYIARGSEEKLRVIPLVFAGWLRYLMAVDDGGIGFDRSPDPFLSDKRAEYMAGLELGGWYSHETVKSILADKGIFGTELPSSVTDRTMEWFGVMRARAGGVREALEKVLR